MLPGFALLSGSAARSAAPSMFPRVPLKHMDGAMLSFELFREIDRIIPNEIDRQKILSAAMIATDLHSGQTRFVRGNLPRVPYIEHPLRNTLRLIRWGVTNADLLVACLLHDTVEDCLAKMLRTYVGVDEHGSKLSITAQRSAAFAWLATSYSPASARIVRQVTNPVDDTTSYVDHIREMVAVGNPHTLLTKASDLVDNAGSLSHQKDGMPQKKFTRLLERYWVPLELVRAALAELAEQITTSEAQVYAAAAANLAKVIDALDTLR